MSNNKLREPHNPKKYVEKININRRTVYVKTFDTNQKIPLNDCFIGQNIPPIEIDKEIREHSDKGKAGKHHLWETDKPVFFEKKENAATHRV